MYTFAYSVYLIITVYVDGARRRSRRCTMTKEDAFKCAKRGAIFGDRSIRFPREISDMEPFCKLVFGYSTLLFLCSTKNDLPGVLKNHWIVWTSTDIVYRVFRVVSYIWQLII